VIVLGLTGGIGMGKSTAARLLADRGVPVVDTDQLARDVVEPGQPALEEIIAAFGTDVIEMDGQLNRQRLARQIFADPAQRARLEAILHPRIRERWLNQLEEWKNQGRACGVVVIPLLYETKAESQFDTVICVACSVASQQQRLQARDWTGGQIEQRIAAQWPVQKKMDLAHHVVWTEGDLETHAAQLDRILQTRPGA
jgi:dephospho-CoA kinase